jgi:hypothetical protein
MYIKHNEKGNKEIQFNCKSSKKREKKIKFSGIKNSPYVIEINRKQHI